MWRSNLSEASFLRTNPHRAGPSEKRRPQRFLTLWILADVHRRQIHEEAQPMSTGDIARCRGASLHVDQDQSAAKRLAVWTWTERGCISSLNGTRAGHWLKTTSKGCPQSQKRSLAGAQHKTVCETDGGSYLGAQAGRGPRLAGGTPHGPLVSEITTTATPSAAKVKESVKGQLGKSVLVHFSINCFSLHSFAIYWLN